YKHARPDMSEEEARNFAHKNAITRTLGMRDTVAVDIAKVPVHDGDIVVLCLDGLCGMLEDQQMVKIVTESPDLESAVNELVENPSEAGGNDNVTAMVIHCYL